MASLFVEKKPLFPPNSPSHCGTQHGLFFPSQIRESPQPKTLVSLSPFRVHNKPAKISALSNLPMMLPTALNSETRPLSPLETDCSTMDRDHNGMQSSFGAECVCAPMISAISETDAIATMQNSTTPNGFTSIIHVGTVTKEQEEQSLLQKNGPPVSPRKCVLKAGIPTKDPILPPKSPVKMFSTPESAENEREFDEPVCKQFSLQKSRPNSKELGTVKATSPLKSPLSSLSKHNMGRRPPTPPLKSPVTRVPKHDPESPTDNKTEPARDSKQPTPPPKSPLKSTSTIVNSCPFVSPKSTKVNVTQKPSTKFQAHNGTRSSMRLIRIEPTMPTDTSSIYSNRTSRLSLLEDSDSHFPCSISPGTMRSMEFMFSFSDVDILEKLSDSWPVKCTHVVKEVIVTERAYVQSLTDVIKGYLTPLYSYVLQTGESPNFITTVFGNIVKIHQIHTSLLESMQSASTSPENFARVFVDCDFITQYTLYCTGYSKGNKRLEQTLGAVCDIKEFITECQKKLSHPLPLTSYLIKPVQRILKYPLLLEDLSKKFDWTDHPGQEILKQALEKMSSVALQINRAFHDPVKIPKNSPKVIAQRRVNQLRDLQNGRSQDHNHVGSIHYSLSSSNSLPPRATLFPVPSPKHSSMTRFSYMEDKSLASAQQSSVHASANKREGGSKPGVKDLKSFYENLTERSAEEMGRRRTGSNKMTRTNSMDESFVHVPQQVSRTSSIGNLFRFGRSSNKTKDEPEHKSLLRRFGRSKKSKSKV